ncbi:cytochrome c oxidase subunit 3 family protein [Motiliproteus sp. SC1-56]|uniref:cytochrome c oxidase subunit 3 family protein n=1 Tax=Motiliproteus sp. SC1-56 TaxID=2799565 RepID=UPI001A8D2302|nr:cytochrome c oxidase subunit 3 family protein [Motiliproteus sp. SC1-56]
MLSLVASPLALAAAENASRRAPANIAVWILVWAELTEFALFFLVLLVVRAHNPDVFAAGPGQLNTLAGLVNTLLLLTSSFCVARGVAAMQQGRARRCLHWLGGTLLIGAAYLGVKGWEYQWNAAAGFDSRTNVFFTLYYYLTFNHLLHVLVGMCTIGWAMARTHWGHFNAREHEGLEGAACYWHMIDLVWILIFPLLYVLR